MIAQDELDVVSEPCSARTQIQTMADSGLTYGNKLGQSLCGQFVDFHRVALIVSGVL